MLTTLALLGVLTLCHGFPPPPPPTTQQGDLDLPEVPGSSGSIIQGGSYNSFSLSTMEMCVANDQMLMDDVAYLQQSFDEFRESIQEKQEQLINQTAEVTAAVQALREQSDLVLLFMNSGNAGDAISGNESFPEDGLPDEKMMIVMVKDGEMMGTDGRPIPGEIRLKAEEKLPGNETEGEEDDVMADEDLPCPEGQLYYMEKDAMNHSCYMVFKKNLTWYDASTACRVMGGALVSVETAEEHAAVMLYLADKYDGQTPGGVWTAGNDIDREDYWVWSTPDALISYEAWAYGQPNEGEAANCMFLSANVAYLMFDGRCDASASYMCEITVPHEAKEEEEEEGCVDDGCDEEEEEEEEEYYTNNVA